MLVRNFYQTHVEYVQDMGKIDLQKDKFVYLRQQEIFKAEWGLHLQEFILHHPILLQRQQL